MAIQTITYQDKVALNQNSDIADINKCNASDLNEIKSVVNNNANNIGDLSTLTTPTVSNLAGAINSVVESGSNENGNYIKYADGTMICTKKVTFSNVAITNTWGSFYESRALTIGNFAVPFIETPVISLTSLYPNFVEKYGDLSSTSWGTMYACKPRSSTENVAVDCLAIGKWK